MQLKLVKYKVTPPFESPPNPSQEKAHKKAIKFDDNNLTRQTIQRLNIKLPISQ